MKTRLIPVLTLCLIWSQSLFAQELFYGNGYDVATPRGSLALAYKTSFDVSGEEITPGALIFKPDGTKMYVIGTSGKKVNQYSLSIPFDLASTITLDHQYNTGRSVSGLRFSGDGMKLTILSGRTFYQYILSAAYDLSQTVTYDGSEQIFPSGESSLLGFEFNSDGTRVYAVGVDLHEYSLSTAYDFTSTVTFLNTYDITDGSGYSSEIAFNNDGTLMFLGSQHSSGELNKIYRYSLSSAYNITGTVTLEETFDTEPYVVGLTAFAFSASGNDIFAVGTGTDEVAQFGLETPFEFDTEPTTELEGSYIASVQVGSAQDITFSDDGYLMHIIGAAKTSIYQYTLSIPFDITSTVTFDDYYDVGSRETAPTDMTFSDDGMTLFVVGTSNNSVIQYGLSSAYDVGSTVIYEGSRDVSAQQSGVEGITFSSDGMHFFIAGHVDGNGASSEVHQYAITTAFDVTSSTTFEETYAYWNRELSDLTFSDDGQTMLILDNDRIRLDQIDLDTPFELDYGMSYPEYVGGWNVPSEGIPNGIAFSACGTRMYIVGSENNTVYQYRLSSTGVFLETSSNDGSVSGSAKIQLTGDTFTNSGGTLSAKNEYAISNLPSGLSPNLEVSDDGTYVTLTLDGEANNGEDVDDLDDLIFTFEDAAFGKLPASSIANSISARSGFSINFKDNNEPTVENPIADVSRIGGFITAGIDLSSTFEDVDDQSLTYSAISLNTSVATVSVSGDILTFNEQGAGTTTITVTANDGEGGTVAESFDLTITAKPKALAYGLGYDLVTASNVTFEHVTTGNIASGTPAGITFGNDGSKLFFAYSGSVWQYSLEAPYDMTSNASYDGFYNFSSQESSAADVHFSYDGMKMYVAGSAGNPDYIEQYLLTVPFDITLGVTYDGPANVGNSNPTAVAFNNTGNKMYVGNAYGGASIEQFSVTTPFDALSGLTSDGSVSLSELTNIGAWSFNHDGSKLFVLDATAHDIEEYALSANYDITSGLTHLGIFSLVGFDNAPRGIAFNKNGSKVYSVGYGIDDVNQFAVGTTGGFIETSANDGSVEGSLLISLSFDSFTNTNSTLEHEVDYTIDNLPAGLIPDLTVSENGDYAVLTLGGAATSAKEDADDIASLIFTFENSAFEDGDAASVTAAVSASSGFGIDFSDNNVPTLENTISDNSETLGFGYKIYDLTGMFADGDDQTLDISASSDDHNVVTVSLDGNNLTVTQAGVGTATITVTANDGNDGEIQDSFHFEVIADAPALTFGQGYDVSSATFSGATSGLLSEFSFPYSYGVSFNPDGTRMFILFESHIAQFKVSTPFDANTATTLDIDLGFTEETDMTDLAFSADGLKLFLTGTNGAPDYIEQYTLGAPFDLTSGVTHDGSHPIGLSQPHTITFNNDGTKLFVFNYEPSIYEYTLSTPYDILSGTSLVGSEDLSSEMSVPGTMVFSNDGLIMTILDRINGNVIVYELASPYNVLGTRTDLGSLDVSSINSPTGIHFNIDGSQMFIIGGNYDEVATYDAVKTGGFEESIANDGEVDGSLGINLTFDSFMQVGSTLTHGVDFTVDNLPNGLVPVLNIMDAHHAVLTFEGQAVNHEIANDVADIQLTFANSAFAGGDAAAISNTSSASSGFGIEFLPDTTPPTITLFSPNNGAAGVLNDTPIVLTFSEPVQLTGVGTINIKRVSNNASLHSIDPAGAEVVIDENVVTITPDGGILSTEEEVQVYVNWSTTPFEDLAGNDFNDLFGDSDYRFTVDNDIDEVPPSPVTFSPADEAINVSPSADLVITFDEEVESTGQVRYARVKRKSNDEILMSMAMHDPAVTDVSGSTVTISLPSDMPESTELYIEIPASAIQDLEGNLYAGFADNETWDFTTADITPPTITNFSPVNGAVSVSNDEPIVLTFSEPIQQTNYPNDFIRIRRVSNNDTFHEIEAEDATQVTIDGNVVTIQPAGGIIDTEEEVQVYVQWSSTPFEDLSGNDFNDLFSSSDYRFTVDNTPAFITWNGSVWSNGTGPGAGSDDVVIAGNYTTGTHGAIDVKNITINEGFTYTVSAGDQLYVVEDINNNGSLVIESGGDLMSFETGSITGNNIEIYRNTTYADGRYSFVGTPMEQSANNTNTTIGSHVYYYDESQPYDPNEGLGRWITMSGELLPGVGYTQANQEIILFEGFPNVSTVNVTGTYTGTPNDGINEENEGWMLVANPFSTAIDVADFLAANSFTIEGSVYLWDDNGSDNGRGTNSDYIVANSEMATNTTPAGGGDRYDGVLGSAQGFFVKLKSNFGTQISFNPDQRVTGSNSDDNFFRKSVTPHARINLTNTEGLFKQTIVAWKEGISDELANQSFDAKVFSSRSADLIYTTKGEANLAIQGISNERELIELVVNVSETGTYTLGIENKSAAPGKRLYLYDAETDELVDLSISDHTFSASAGQIKNRFELRTASRALALEDENVNIYAFNKTLHIETAGSQPAQYQIFNLSGVSVLKALVAGSTQIDLGHLSNGVYIVSDGVETKKIILK